MIRLRKSQEPTILRLYGAAWTKEFLEQRAADALTTVVRFRYRNAEIKERLRGDSYDKCIYCESKISHVFPGETDHIEPVSVRPDRYVEWENLAYVCTECNRQKGAYYDPSLPLLNPYIDDPRDHLLFLGPLVVHVPGSRRGEVTVRRLKLSRPPLFERRRERLEQLHDLVCRYFDMDAGHLKDLIRAEIVRQVGDEYEYAASARAYLDSVPGWQDTTASLRSPEEAGTGGG